MQTLADAAPSTRALFRFEQALAEDPAGLAAIAGLRAEPSAPAVIAAFAETIESMDPPRLIDRERFRQAAAATGRRAGVKGRALYHPIRVAVTAADAGPELDRVVPLIDQGSSLQLPEPMVSCARRARLAAQRLSAGPAA
jgi:glutamyl-tRNA synthetase/nondiscriminating glutamyl-tRNA synthetase